MSRSGPTSGVRLFRQWRGAGSVVHSAVAEQPYDNAVLVEVIEVVAGLPSVSVVGVLAVSEFCKSAKSVGFDPLAFGGEQGEGGYRPRCCVVEVRLRVAGESGDRVGVGSEYKDPEAWVAFPGCLVV